MTDFHAYDQETIYLHGGQEPDPSTGSRAVPIHQTTSYVFKDTEHAQNLFGLKEPGHIYTRINNPTIGVFEERMAQLEDGSCAVATASGMAAITLSILNLAGAGDEIVVDSNLYGGTYNLFAITLPRYGIHAKLIDGTDLDAIRSAISPNTKAIFGEIITNPSLNVLDVEGIATIAHENNIPLIIDNTFATPYGCKPLAWGADIVVHSATKWIGGHGNSIGGVVVDGGRFNWDQPHFPDFIEPDESYNGIRYADLAPAAFGTKLRVQLLRDFGPALSPHSAFLLLQGLETLHLRVERHNQNAEKVAAFLQNNPAVEWVNYPGLTNHPSHALANKYLQNGYGSMITFGIKGGREAGKNVIENISLWSHVANVGDAKSLIIHPASTTHQQLNAEDLQKSGVSEELIRLAIGIENVQDVLLDLDQAIAKATDMKETIPSSQENALKWLLSSPFVRENGTVRQKTIAIAGEGHIEQETNQLQQLGFRIVRIDNQTTSDHLPEVIDAVWQKQGVLPDSLLKHLTNQQTPILLVERANDADQIKGRAEASGVTVITGFNPYQVYIQLRDGEKDREATNV